MAQAKKKQATKTAKKCTSKCSSCQQKKKICYKKYDRNQQSNMIFVIAMSVLATALLFADLVMAMA